MSIKAPTEIKREVHLGMMTWPGRSFGGTAYGLGNLEYQDLRRTSWSDAEDILNLESELIERIQKAAKPYEEYVAISDELYEDPDAPLLYLDLGVASLVAAVAAAGCIPVSS